MADVTRLLHRVRAGDRAALEELMPLVYGELRRIAGSLMHRQHAGHTLQPTAVVHEAFLKVFLVRHELRIARAWLRRELARKDMTQ